MMDRRPLHILIVPPEEFVPPQSPVSAIFQLHQGLALRDLGHRVGVLSVTPSLALKPLLVSLFRKLTGRRTFYRQIEGASVAGIFRAICRSLWLPGSERTALIDGLTVFRRQLRCWSDGTQEEELAYYRRTVASAFHAYLLSQGRPDVVHVHNAWLAGTACVDLLASAGIPFCLTEHSTYYARNIIPEHFYPQLVRVYAAAGANIAVSPSLAQLLKERKLATSVRYIPNILDPGFVRPLPGNGNPSEVFIFFNVAELTEKKGHALLLEAFASAFRCNARVRLCIGGDGALKESLKQQCDDLGLVGQVEFLGILDRETIRRRMLEADVFVLPSLFETFGVVIIEAMSCGKPVIATACGGPEHILDERLGLLIPAGDFRSLQDALCQMYETSRSYDPEEIRSRALSAYGPDVVGRAIERVYLEILDNSVHE